MKRLQDLAKVLSPEGDVVAHEIDLSETETWSEVTHTSASGGDEEKRARAARRRQAFQLQDRILREQKSSLRASIARLAALSSQVWIRGLPTARQPDARELHLACIRCPFFQPPEARLCLLLLLATNGRPRMPTGSTTERGRKGRGLAAQKTEAHAERDLTRARYWARARAREPYLHAVT